MSETPERTAENAVPDSTGTPVAPETAPVTASAEAETPEQVAAVAAPETIEIDAEPVIATAATPTLATTVDTSDVTGGVPVLATPETTATTVGRRGKRDQDRPKRGPVRPEGPAPLGHFAVVETGGKQYRVSVGDRIAIERLEGEAGSEITLDRVLMVGGDGEPRIGAPVVEGAAVTATIETQYRGEKIIIFKMKPKKRYRRRTGHRQNLTRIAITAITA